jgi:hypothetical protein
LPDVFQDRLSAFAGCTIGICRMFLLGAMMIYRFCKPFFGNPVSRYKCTYKYYL